MNIKAYKIVDDLIMQDLKKNGRRMLLEVAQDFKNSLEASASSFAYRLIKSVQFK